jgi:hypothetical protein
MEEANIKLTALANSVRELSGTTSIKGIVEMTDDVTAANTEIAEQADLLTQIANALEGKAAGSGGTTLPTLTNPASESDILTGKEAIDGEGNVVTGTIETKTSSNLTVSGSTVTVPAGYYASQATKSVASGSAKTPATTITKNPSISVDANGKITASVSGTQNVTPTVSAGYVSSGTAGTITVSGSATKQLTTQAAKTITPSTNSQTAVTSGVYTTGAVTVGPIPSNYEDVGAETTEYTSLNAELEAVINSLPSAGGSSGGGSVETCTVTITTLMGGFIQDIFITQCVDGVISTLSKNIFLTTTTIENVVCGSALSFYTSAFAIIPNSSATDGAKRVGVLGNNWVFSAPTVANANATIEVWDDD